MYICTAYTIKLHTLFSCLLYNCMIPVKAEKRSYKSIRSLFTLEMETDGLKTDENKMKTEILSTITDAYKTEFPDLFVSVQILGTVSRKSTVQSL